MDKVIAFLSLASFIFFLAGLINPSLVGMPNRKRASAIYLGGCLALAVLGANLYPVEEEVEKSSGLLNNRINGDSAR
jgi:hypothetical protein